MRNFDLDDAESYLYNSNDNSIGALDPDPVTQILKE